LNAIVTAPAREPGDAGARHHGFVGVQPSLTQVPPTCLRSTSAVRRPEPASAIHKGVPPWPEPITIAWYCLDALILSRNSIMVRRGSESE
jgi:hypothetical protein